MRARSVFPYGNAQRRGALKSPKTCCPGRARAGLRKVRQGSGRALGVHVPRSVKRRRAAQSASEPPKPLRTTLVGVNRVGYEQGQNVYTTAPANGCVVRPKLIRSSEA